MKKIFTFLIVVAFAFAARAQINYYNFAATQGAYSEISGGTIVYAGTAEGDTLVDIAYHQGGTVEAALADVPGFPIGFSFAFGTTTFDSFAINANGFIYLGNGTFTVDTRETSLGINVSFGTGTLQPVLEEAADASSGNSRFSAGSTNLAGFSLFGGALANAASYPRTDASTEISYLLAGENGSRVLTVQFKDYKFLLDASYATLYPADFQIKLYEAGGKVEFIFNFTGPLPTTWPLSANVGLKGATLGNSFYTTASNSSNWLTASAATTGVMAFKGVTIPEGLTYTFTPPPACVAPTSAPTNLQLTATSSSISGTFTKAEEGADKYIVLFGETPVLVGTNDKLVDGTVYNLGDPINNKWKVVHYGAETSFVVDDLDGSTDYTVLVFAANDVCIGGPLYFNTYLRKDIKTLPAAPVLRLAEGGFTTIQLSATANIDNDPIIIAQNIGQYAFDGSNNRLNDGLFGTPALSLNVGDAIEGGGRVIYKGAVSEAVEVTGLSPNKLVNFAAWSYNETDNLISSEPKKFNNLTWGELPYLLNPAQFSYDDIPVDWEKNEGSTFRLEGDRTIGGTYLSCNFLTGENIYNSLATQWLKLSSNQSRFVLEGSLNYATGQSSGSLPYTTWNENDSLVVSVLKYGETDYTPIYTFKESNKNTFGGDYHVVVPVIGFGNEIVKVKLSWLYKTSTWNA
ncbi:MAG: hypothetical protein LBS25_06935, partial [Candidatus Symbiothrix sp.]|nr:hypothetical protein [Candidatus Symbiothrix sp.]